MTLENERGYNINWEEHDFNIKLIDDKIDASGSIPITWCLSTKALEFLKGIKKEKVWVMFASTAMAYNGRITEYRSYTSLNDMMAYITFLRPGKNKIIARITTEKDVVKRWMKREDGVWAHDVFYYPTIGVDEDIENWTYPISNGWGYCLHNQNYYSYQPYGTLEVDVPSECFAPEPPEWEKAWVNFFWTNKAVDQCEYRKRRLLAYPWQAAPFLVILALRTILVFIPMCLGFYNLNLNPIYSPLNYSTEDIFENRDIKNFFFINSLGSNCPIGIIFPILIWISAITLYFGHIMVPAFIWEFVAFVWLAFFIGSNLQRVRNINFSLSKIGNLVKPINNVVENWNKVNLEKSLAKQEEEYQMLLCSRDIQIKAVKDLPFKKRTFKLAFQGLKSKVCRPYSR